jgi:peptidoglycan-associated lipoprotein
MRAQLITLAAAVALAAACGSKKPKVDKPDDDTTTATPDKPTTPTPEDTASTAVSPNISISADLAARCGIKENAEVPPNFAYDQVELLPEDRAVLEQIATCLTTGPLAGKGLTLVGRADPRGTQEYNMGLGARRAQSVSNYLQKLGVTSPQLAETTKGDLEATGTDESTWAKDRRVDLELRD